MIYPVRGRRVCVRRCFMIISVYAIDTSLITMRPSRTVWWLDLLLRPTFQSWYLRASAWLGALQLELTQTLCAAFITPVLTGMQAWIPTPDDVPPHDVGREWADVYAGMSTGGLLLRDALRSREKFLRAPLGIITELSLTGELGYCMAEGHVVLLKHHLSQCNNVTHNAAHYLNLWPVHARSAWRRSLRPGWEHGRISPEFQASKRRYDCLTAGEEPLVV